jgi:hypothetical protein
MTKHNLQTSGAADGSTPAFAVDDNLAGPARRVVAQYPEYGDAQRAVDFLATSGSRWSRWPSSAADCTAWSR